MIFASLLFLKKTFWVKSLNNGENACIIEPNKLWLYKKDYHFFLGQNQIQLTCF